MNVYAVIRRRISLVRSYRARARVKYASSMIYTENNNYMHVAPTHSTGYVDARTDYADGVNCERNAQG